jgi:hypothetical protein
MLAVVCKYETVNSACSGVYCSVSTGLAVI